MVDRPPDTELIAILAPFGRDAALIARALESQGKLVRIVGSAAELCDAIEGELGAVIVTAEGLTNGGLAAVVAKLEAQESWSDLPILLLASSAAADTASSIRALGNVSVLEKPLHVGTLITSARSALRARRRQYAVRTALLAREQFLAMLGHELRNPLGAILFATEILERKPGGPSAERQVGIIRRQASHLSRLVDDLLEVSRVTTGKLRLERQVHELGESVHRTVQALAPALRTSGHRLTHSAQGPAIWVEGDPVRLEQVFSNLLTNAMKYTPEGGTIDVGVAREGAGAVVRFKDTGIGIDPAMQSRIFEVFEQATPALDRSKGGMGLGLTLVRQLVELHGGTVEAHSAGLGHGSEFVVRLPIATNGKPARASAPQPAATAPPVLRVVLVEDSPDICEAFAELLRSEGHDVQVAMDGRAGLELIVREQPDCAFVDIGLPGLDGYQVAQAVRTRLGPKIPMVALTGYGQPQDRKRAIDAGFDRHLTKPISLAVVTGLLNAIAQFHAIV